MTSSRGSDLSRRLDMLRGEPSAQARGQAFERFLAGLFSSSHYAVRPSPDGPPRQVDLVAERGSLRLLIEAKWTKSPASHSALDGLEARLRQAQPGTVGVLVSMSGFSRPLIERVERAAASPVLLVNGAEVEWAAAAGDVHTLIMWKHTELRQRNRAVFGPPASTPLWLQALPESTLRLVDVQGESLPLWEGPGDFSSAVPVVYPADSAWARRGAVRLSLRPSVRTAEELVQLLFRLAQVGYLSTEGTWRIEQQGLAWTGLGAAELAKQLVGWEVRYAGRRLHHSEKVVYSDNFGDGSLVLNADIDAHEHRSVRWCEVSFMLPGIPLDVTPFETLRTEVALDNYPSFEVLDYDPVRRTSFQRGSGYIALEPKAYLLRDDMRRDASDSPWVVGVVAAPFRASPKRARKLGLSSYQVGETLVHLGQAYEWGDDVTHHLQRASAVQFGEIQALHIRGDWAFAKPDPERVWT